MKRFFVIFLILVIVMLFSTCSNDNISTTRLLNKEGVAPYELSESDLYLLKSLGLERNTKILTFKAPKSAKSLKVNVYVMYDNKTWDVMGGGEVSLGQDANPEERLEGTFAMRLKDDYAIEFHISAKGAFSFQTNTLDANYEDAVSLVGFLMDFQEIELNKEIPVAIMVYDRGNLMKSYTMEDYFSPSSFEGMDMVQAVTLIYSDEVD